MGGFQKHPNLPWLRHCVWHNILCFMRAEFSRKKSAPYTIILCSLYVHNGVGVVVKPHYPNHVVNKPFDSVRGRVRRRIFRVFPKIVRFRVLLTCACTLCACTCGVIIFKGVLITCDQRICDRFHEVHGLKRKTTFLQGEINQCHRYYFSNTIFQVF